MASIGKKILSAFVEVTEESKPVTTVATKEEPATVNSNPPPADNGKFIQYFDKLFADANIPGPDYFEFSKMIEAMQSIPDERARYSAAFAGLAVQGLDKQKLLSTAEEYIKLLESDAGNFRATISTAVQDKVQAKKQEMEEKTKRIQQLSQEITDLQNKITVLNNEIKENEEKIHNNASGYEAECQNRKNAILQNMEKIKQHIN
jgi:hypothetical protein